MAHARALWLLGLLAKDIAFLAEYPSPEPWRPCDDHRASDEVEPCSPEWSAMVGVYPSDIWD